MPDSAIERAKLLSKIQRQAKAKMEEFQSSQGEDFEALLECAELCRQTTVISPSDCSNCYRHYGETLTRIGLYHETLIGLLREELRGASPARRAEIEKSIGDHRQQAREAYANSNRQFESYFRITRDIDPYAYQWVYQQAARIGRFDEALYYLDLFAANMRLDDNAKREVELIKKRYSREQQRQQEQEFEQELYDELRLDRSPSNRDQMAN